jgi:hypothetical protein
MPTVRRHAAPPPQPLDPHEDGRLPPRCVAAVGRRGGAQRRDGATVGYKLRARLAGSAFDEAWEFALDRPDGFA